MGKNDGAPQKRAGIYLFINSGCDNKLWAGVYKIIFLQPIIFFTTPRAPLAAEL